MDHEHGRRFLVGLPAAPLGHGLQLLSGSAPGLVDADLFLLRIRGRRLFHHKFRTAKKTDRAMHDPF